ncbi:LPS assembly lipoprotein LptE [Chelatococcus composti]|jgi:LPS-assembly lipoprotein|uniref:LPS-assembly lipoprotein n=1 Tax=Chelatococcus composti TaxID=1743235 RepID=A0A841K9B0_9HYPH|nr:LPS assembly lipoprotein LptE [Chelatococcus composti]MBB6167464.1 LPS-assembly lipoprotein [Chelatococcus composti]MBS7735669.1 hypothetical protein [Chelatococcus composti]GGG32128.1 hypothetical protein GCM10008026_10840 [Chelatococcus composti]
MSSPDRLFRGAATALRLAAVAALALGLAGCLRPLYAERADGTTVQDTLRTIEVASISDIPGQERFAHYLRNEVVFRLTGGNEALEPQYILELSPAGIDVRTAIVDTVSGNAQSANLQATVNFVLKRVGQKMPVLTGKATASASYDRNPQRFASTRAARDAEIRVAKELAEQISARIAAVLATRD